jgi:hypothetical protein
MAINSGAPERTGVADEPGVLGALEVSNASGPLGLPDAAPWVRPPWDDFAATLCADRRARLQRALIAGVAAVVILGCGVAGGSALLPGHHSGGTVTTHPVSASAAAPRTASGTP